MAEKYILHMVTPLKHMSPFDVNMAVDAGCDVVITHTDVSLGEVSGLVQDAIFSRPPKTGARTGMFFGGKNAVLALDMMAAAKKALVPPFGLSLFADPAGSFTTAAALVACAEKTLRQKKNRDLRGLKVAVFGATGVVGFSAGVSFSSAMTESAASATPPRRSRRGSASTSRRRMAATMPRRRASSPMPRWCSARAQRVPACSRRLRSRRREICCSPPTSMRCRLPASKVWQQTPAARH